MLQTKTQNPNKVVERLQAEGWVECPGLGFPALAQHPLSDLRALVLEQLHRSGGQMELVDLQLAVLIFSVPTHRYEIHPQLPWLLQRLKAEGVIEITKARSAGASAAQGKGMVQLRAAGHCSFG